jgi:hypothetical protein
MAIHTRMVQASTTQAIGFFAFRARIIRFVFYIAYKCATCSEAKHVFSWMGKNEMIN